jgi:glycosyltransferase involved in cell wall biosynthesis
MAESDNAFVVGGYGVLNRNPLLLHIWFSQESPFPFIEAISDQLSSTPALIFVTNACSILSRWKNDWAFTSYLHDYRSHRHHYPHHPVVMMANDAMEAQFLSAHGIDAVLFQQNGFMNIDEKPRASAKEFDAVYIARIKPHKRIELAQNIASCCIVFAAVDVPYFREIQPLVSHFVFANGDPLSSESQPLPRAQVADWCARSRCGLCLSADVEGAMFASAEYMLWGLPVVSTRSFGGREDYFDERFCLICEDDPASVAAAVTEAISRNVESGLIRNTFLAKVMERRAGLLRFVIDRTSHWRGSLEKFNRDLLNIGTPFLERFHWFTAPQLLNELADKT